MSLMPVRDELGRLRVLHTEELDGATKHVCEFEFRDPRGTSVRAKGKIYAPTGGEGPLPLAYLAGYEFPDDMALAMTRQGFVAVNPPTPEPGSLWPSENPITRSINLDVALLHIARSLPFVDVGRVLLVGGSAGAYVALMLAAESFPVAGVVVQNAPLNWGYNAAVHLHNMNPVIPATMAGAGFAHNGMKLLGQDPTAPVWFAHSPVGHVEEITCIVHSCCTTADMLVPVDQVARELVRTPEPGVFPEGFTTVPEEVSSAELNWVRLTDVVSDLELHVLEPPPGAEPLDVSNPPKSPYRQMKMPAGRRRWTVCAVDEGPPTPGVAHERYAWSPDRGAFLERVMSSDPHPGQASEAKLRVLANRYAGRGWIDSDIPHLDLPEAEEMDVELGIKWFRSLPGAEEALTKLPDDLVAELL